jgi:Fe-S cluster assembly iron-binding protein IscA
MLEITKSASEKIAEYLKGKAVTPIRIFLDQGG